MRKIGFYLGKYIYILDAYDDLQEDMKKGSYNALWSICERPDFDAGCEEMLNLVLAECTSQFEQLPCIEDAEILRNILYAGVWDKFEKKRKEKNEQQSI